MNKQVSPKIVALTFGVLVVSFLVAFYVVAWQEPTEAPPGGNVDTPLNVGPDGQSKVSGLILNTGDAENLPAPNALVLDNGNLCLGGVCLASWPATGVITTYSMSVQGYMVDGEYYSKSVSFNCPAGVPIVIDNNSIIVGENAWGLPTEACRNSISDNNITLEAFIHEHYSSGGATNDYVVDDCVFFDPGPYRLTCIIRLPCWIKFQCGILETVGE